jgi:serine/threonine-protein phosphatase 2B catalytic subunit
MTNANKHDRGETKIKVGESQVQNFQAIKKTKREKEMADAMTSSQEINSNSLGNGVDAIPQNTIEKENVPPSGNLSNPRQEFQALKHQNDSTINGESLPVDISPPIITTATKAIDDRVCKDVPMPAMQKILDEVFYKSMDPIILNTEAIKTHFLAEGLLNTSQALYILRKGAEILRQEPNCLSIPAPVNICGDIHGQFYDLKRLFNAGGSIVGEDGSTDTGSTYLFLGDYVDRGYFSMECLLYLLSLKITYPNKIFMLRGNHECQHLTEYFTFRGEAIRKYSKEIYEACLYVFNSLPLCAVVNKQFFCVHGGISPQLKSLADVDAIDRFQEPPTRGLFCDMLWSDPAEDFDKENSGKTFTSNSVRGCSYSYNFTAVTNFLRDNDLLCIVRAHEAQNAGYRMYKRNPATSFPAVITIFSAPNYVDVYKNKAAILKYDGITLNIKQFSHTQHPYWLPKFMDVFSWSIPFVCEKMMDMLTAILSSVSKEELHPDYQTPEQKARFEAEEQQKLQLMTKIRAVSRLARVYNLLRTERESIMELKTLMKTDKLPSGTLALGAEGIRRAITGFEDARKIDIQNEHLPPIDHDSFGKSMNIHTGLNNEPDQKQTYSEETSTSELVVPEHPKSELIMNPANLPALRRPSPRRSAFVKFIMCSCWPHR